MSRQLQKDKKTRKIAKTYFGLTDIEIKEIEELKSRRMESVMDNDLALKNIEYLISKPRGGVVKNSLMMNMDLSLFAMSKEKEQSQDPIMNVILGSEVALELPDTFSEYDRMVITRTRYTRRNAVHIYDGEQLKTLLNTYLTSKNLMCFFTIGYNQLKYIDMQNEVDPGETSSPFFL